MKYNTAKTDYLYSLYEERKLEIQKRLSEFKAIFNKDEKTVFAELAFCICTPQSKAIQCDKVIRTLVKTKLLFNATQNQLKKNMSRVRFPNNKSKYIFETRKRFFDKSGKIKIKYRIDKNNILETRDWFVKNVLGIGYKEASHFLRNIGFGEDIAILDVHIIRNMIELNVLNSKPKTLTRNIYLELENKLRVFSKFIRIPMAELDLLIWSKETGKIFK